MVSLRVWKKQFMLVCKLFLMAKALAMLDFILFTQNGCSRWKRWSIQGVIFDLIKSVLFFDMCMTIQLYGCHIKKFKLLDFILLARHIYIKIWLRFRPSKVFRNILQNLMKTCGATCICYKCLCKYAWILPLQFCAVCIAPTQEYWMCLLIHLYWHWVFSSIHLPLMTIKDSSEARKVDKCSWFELVYLF